MSENLPIELVCEMLRTAAEALLVDDRQTVLHIALTATLGYGVATPILYRTLYVDDNNKEIVLRIFFDGQSNTSNKPGILRDPPSRRLCPLVRRLFTRYWNDLAVEDLKKLVNMERFLLYHDFSASNELEVLEALSPCVTHLGVMSQTDVYFATPSMTHISYDWDNRSSYELNSDMESQVLAGLLLRPTARALTHIALDLCVELVAGNVDGLRRTVQTILARSKTKVLALHLLGKAAQLKTQEIVVEMLREVVQSEEDRERMVLWFDPRSLDSEVEDIRVCWEEFILGRDVWTEGRPIELEEQERAQA